MASPSTPSRRSLHESRRNFRPGALSGGVGVYTGPAPPGAGPYTFSGLVFNGEYAILKRNPNYGGSRPQHLDAIAFREGIDTERAVARVVSGNYDAIEQYG